LREKDHWWRVPSKQPLLAYLCGPLHPASHRWEVPIKLMRAGCSVHDFTESSKCVGYDFTSFPPLSSPSSATFASRAQPDPLQTSHGDNSKFYSSPRRLPCCFPTLAASIVRDIHVAFYCACNLA
ncbi:hypothetical protein CI238_08904, partial [Colletotrichum incanum]